MEKGRGFWATSSSGTSAETPEMKITIKSLLRPNIYFQNKAKYSKLNHIFVIISTVTVIRIRMKIKVMITKTT